MHWLWPSPCMVCGILSTTRVNPGVCEPCWELLPRLHPPVCPRCGAPFRSSAARSHSDTHWCWACREREPRFDRARAAVSYEGVAAAAIRSYKYLGRRVLARPLSTLLGALIDDVAGPVHGVVPVPLHRRRLQERGYNQALLLADALARSAGWPLYWDLLERVRPTRSQVGLAMRERRRNVRGAFAVRATARLEGKNLLLVDDVLTTGSTVDECAGLLKREGATTVQVLTVARQVEK